EEKEQLLQYKSTVAGLVGRSKSIVQLKPRNPDNLLKASIPIKAICDYRQIEITIYKDDECVLASNSHRAKWKVISPSGNEAMVPSVCFTVPPPNKEAIDIANRIEQQYQNVLTLWHESHINMKSVVSWHYLTHEIETVRAGNVASIKTLLPGEHQQVLSNLQSRFDDFLEDSQESKVFSVADIAQLEREVNVCKEYYQELLKSAEREEHEESIYNLYISEVRNIRLCLEHCEDRLIRQIRTPLERDDLHESVFRISEQEKLKKELDRLKEDLETVTDKCDEFFSQAAGSPSVPTLRSELNLVIQNMDQIYSMSSIYIEKLKTVNLVLKNTQGAESLVKLYETKLCEEEPLTADRSNTENLMGTLKQWRSEVDEKREVFHALEDELQKAKAISDQMFKAHKERDLDFDWHKEKADQLTERWQNVHSQIENRLRDLEGINKSLKYYRDTYSALDSWIKQVEETQQRFQENPSQNSKALLKQLNQQKMLVSEIEMKQIKLDECQKYSEQYSAAVKDYELQTMTYRAMVDSQQKSPVKRRRMQSSSDFIIQEFMDLRTRYTALVTLMTQYIKFAGDSLKRLEEEEILKNNEALVRGENADLEAQQKTVVNENRKLMERINELEEMLKELRKQKFQLEEELPKVKGDAEKKLKKQQKAMEEIILQKTKAEQEAKRYCLELEDILKEKEASEQEVDCLKQRTLKAEAQRSIVEENLRTFRIQLEESALVRKTLEEHLKRKDTNLNDLEQQKKALMKELKKKSAEEEKLMTLIREMEQDLEFQGSLMKNKLIENETTEVRRQITITECSLGRETLLPVGSDVTDFQRNQEIKNLEDFQQLVDELTFANKKSDKIIKDLKYELNELELQKLSSEQKARLLKEKLDDANNSLRCIKLELDQKEQTEQGYLEQLKELDRQLHKAAGKAEEVMQEAMDLKKIKLNYEEELRMLQKEKAQLKRELEELTRTHGQTEIIIPQLNSQITALRQEKIVAEQRSISFRGEASNLQEQLRKIKEQLLQKTREEKENQSKIQQLTDDLTKSNHLVETMKQKVEELTRQNSENKIIISEVRSESEKIILKRQIIDRKNDELKALVDSFKEQLRVTNEQLHKQIITEQEHLDKIKRLEGDLSKAKDLTNEFKQKCDRQDAYNVSAEVEVRNLSSQLSTLTMEMKMGDQKIQQQQAHIQDLQSKLKKLQDDFHQKTLDEQMARKKVALLQEESIKFKHSAEEFRKKFEKLSESHSITENDISGIRLECVALQQEKHMAQENIRMFKIQIEDLQDRLQKCREQLQQGKHAEMDYWQKYRKLEEELQVQRRTVENMKHQIDLQKREHCHQLRLFQNEIHKKNYSNWDFGWKGNGFRYLGDASPREYDQLNLCASTSPLLRRRQIEISTAGCKPEQLVTKKLQAVVTDSLPKEKQFQLSGITHSQENGISQQSFSEYVSQTSAQLEITFDKVSPVTRISELDKLRDSKLLSSRYEDNYEMGLGKHLHPLERVNSQRYGVHAEVTTLDQENDKTFGNEGRLLEGYRSSEGFRSEDASKISSFLEEKKAKEVDMIPSDYDNIKFQGLRQDVTARQLIEAKLLDMVTAEQLHLGKKTISEVQKNLDKFLTKPTAIAGLYTESNKDRISFPSAAQRRITEKAFVLSLLEAEAATGFIIDPATGQKYSVDDAVLKGLVDQEHKSRLLEAEKAVLGYQFSGKKLSVYEAIETRLLERQKGKNILEAQIASGGIIDPVRSVRIPPEAAVQLGLLNSTMLNFLYEPSSNKKCFQNPNNKQAMYYKDLLKLCLLDIDSKCFLLPVGERKITTPSVEKIHKISVVDVKTGSEMTSYEAYKKGLIDKSTYLELSGQEYQWKDSTCFDPQGSSYLLLTDLKTGMQFNIDEALGQGKIDRTLVSKYKDGQITANELGDVLLSNSKPLKDVHSPIAGVWLCEMNERMPLLKAARKNLLDRMTALRCLEAQASTGGIIDPCSGKKYSVAEALQRELIDEATAKHTQPCELAFTGIIHPVTKNIMSATEAMNNNALDKEMGTRCLEYQYLTGGLIDPKSHSKLSMEDAIKNGIVDAITATKMKNDKFYCQIITCPKTKKKLTYKEALERAVFDCHTGLRLLEKSMEEEKKEHVEKAVDLMKWVSNITKGLSKGEGERPEKADFLKKQISSDELSAKKEQISEALQTTQSFLAKHSDKLTDEEKNEMENHMRSLHEGYKLLSNEDLKQLQEKQNVDDENMDEKVDKVIAGIIDQTTGEVFSVFQSLCKGLIDYDTGIRLLESQLILSGLISPDAGKSFDLEEARACKLVDEQTASQLQVLQKAKKIISESQGTVLPVVAAFEKGLISESLAIKILEIQLSRGHLTMPATGERLTLQKAFQRNLVSAKLYTHLLKRRDMYRDLIDPNTTEKISLEELLERTVINKDTGLRLLPVTPQEKGKIVLKCGRKISIPRAAHEGLIERETMLRLLGTQLLSGGIVHPEGGHRMSIEEAMGEGVIDQDAACAILTHQVQTGGIVCPSLSKRLTIDEAVQCHLISSSSALLVLQAQQAFIGLIWPHSGEIFPVSTCLHQGMVTNELACKILSGRQKIAALYIPETCEVIGLDNAVRRGEIDSNSASVLSSVALPDKIPNVDDTTSPFKRTARSVTYCELHPLVQHDDKKDVDASDAAAVSPRSSEQAQKLFISYLLINSYMDASTGQRLLLYCGDLNETVSLLTSGSDSAHSASGTAGQFYDTNESTKAPTLQQQQPENVALSYSISDSVGQQRSVQNISSNCNRKEPCKKTHNDESSGRNYATVVASGSEQSKCAVNSLVCKQECGSGRMITTDQNPEKQNVFQSLAEHSEQMLTEVCEKVTESPDVSTGDAEESVSKYSLRNLLSKINEGSNYIVEETKENENSSLESLNNFLDINYPVINEEVVQKSTDVSHLPVNTVQKCVPNILQSKGETVSKNKDEVKDEFQNSSYTSMESGNKRLNKLTQGECVACNEGEMLQSETSSSLLPLNYNDGNHRAPLQGFTDSNGTLPLRDHTLTCEVHLPKDSVHMEPRQEELVGICGCPPLEESTNKSRVCPLEDHTKAQDTSALGSTDDKHHLSLKYCSSNHSMPVLENHTFAMGEDKTGCINEFLLEQQIESRSLENHVDERDGQQLIDKANLCSMSLSDSHTTCSMSLSDSHTTCDGVPPLESCNELRQYGTLREDDNITHLELPLEDYIDTNARPPEDVSPNILDGPSIKISIDSQSNISINCDLSVPPRVRSVGDINAIVSHSRLLLEDINSKPSETQHENKHSTLRSENGNDHKDRKDPCGIAQHADSSKQECDAIQVESDSDYYHLARTDEDNTFVDNRNVFLGPDINAVAIMATLEKPVSIQDGGESSQISLNNKEENILCLSELSDMNTFEIMNTAAFSARILDTVLEEVEESVDVEKKDQGKECEERKETDLTLPLKVCKATLKGVGHEKIRKGESEMDESEDESLYADNDGGGNDDTEDDFNDYDYMDLDYDTSDDTDYEDEEVMEMHYSQCREESARLQVSVLLEMTGSESLHTENSLHSESKHDLLCFENYRVDECQNLADSAEESIQKLPWKSNKKQKEAKQASESVLENEFILQDSSEGISRQNSEISHLGADVMLEIGQAEIDLSPEQHLCTEQNKSQMHEDGLAMSSSDRGPSQAVDDEKLIQANNNLPNSQLESSAWKQDGIDIPMEDNIQESSGLRETLEDICSSVIKNGSEIIFLCDQRSKESVSVTHSSGISTDVSVGHTEDFDLSTYLKQCAKDVQAKDILALKEEGAYYFKEVESDPGGMQNMNELKVTGNKQEKQHAVETDSKALLTFTSLISEVEKSGDSKDSKVTVHSEAYNDTVHMDKHAINSIGPVEAVEELGNSAATKDHKHIINLSPNIVATTYNNRHSTEQKVHEMLVSHGGEEVTKEDTILDQGSTFSENIVREKMQQPQKDAMSPDFTPVEEHFVHSSEVSATLSQGLTSVLSKMEDGRVFYMQEDEPLSYTSTRALMQNLLKMANSTNYEDESSNPSCVKNTNGDIRPSSKTDDADQNNAAPCLWLDNRRPDLLCDILKQDRRSQNIAGMPGTMDKNSQTETEQQEEAATPKQIGSQRNHAFPISNRDGVSSVLEAEAISETTSSCSEAFALKGVHQVDHPSQSFSGDVLEKKEPVAGPDAMSIICSGIQLCSQQAEKLKRHATVVQDMKFFLDILEPISNDLETLKVQLAQLEPFESRLAGFAVTLKKDMKVAEEFGKLWHRDVPSDQLEDLRKQYEHLEKDFFEVCDVSSKRAKQIVFAVDAEMAKLAVLHQKHLLRLQESADWVMEKSETVNTLKVDDLAEQHQEFKEKIQDICDLLTQTENHLIGHQEALVIESGKSELQQYQTKQEELQKDMQANTQALAEIVKNTEMFLKENGEKLSQEDKTALEKKLNEAKTKCLLLSQKAEESRKELDKAVTTAIKQETEKVAAREQLEESKSTIENLLDWLSNMDKDAERGEKKCQPVIKQNGNHFQEGDEEGLAGEDDELNGNLFEVQQQNASQVDGQAGPTEDNLNKQYQKIKAQHEKIISQQQAVLVATQSAQALLEKQGHHLAPEEKDKIQRNMKELKMQYDTALAESERKLKLTRSLQEELEKFEADYNEFESWLQQAEQELENLETGASDFGGIVAKLKRQKSFSEDVISHKGDLRYITISGQRVLDAAKLCNKREGFRYDKEGADSSSTYTEVQSKLDGATGRFKSLYSKCSILGNDLKDLVDKYQNYEDASSGLLSGLQASEGAVNKHLSEAVAVNPKNLQRQLEETKVLQGQVAGHQIAVEKLKKAAEVLLDTRGELLPDKEKIKKTVDTVVDKYNHLSKAVSDRNEKLQITLTRSLSVQDGLNEMLDWMDDVEKSLEKQSQVPLNSAAIQDVISKSMALEQDIAGRQSGLNAMNEKVNKFIETTDPSTASSLQAKMKDLSLRFCEASKKHKKKLEKMEGLKSKVELFECLLDKLQLFLDKKAQALGDADIPGKDVTEMSLYMQETNSELAEQKKDLEALQHLVEEISSHALPGDKSLVLEKVNTLSKKFRTMEKTVREKEEDVSSCQQQMDTFKLHVECLSKWIDEVTERIPTMQPSLNADTLKKHLQNTKNLEDEWVSKGLEIQKMTSRGAALCSLISAVTSPAKSRGVKSAISGTLLNGEGGTAGTQGFLTNKELTSIQQDMSTVSHNYDDLGGILKEKRAELESMLSNMQNVQEESNSMMEWLRKMDMAAAKWEAVLLDGEAVKEQVEQHKLFETELKQNENKRQELKDRVTELLEKNPDSPEAPKWKRMLDKIDSKWKELSQVASDRQKKLEESSNYLTQFQTAESQLKQWLAEKELMVSVLGPLSIDPNMLNTQKQQVQ
ncbi:UNVERIFIED_CONTAM: hypothetical protein K2H54_016108, partial [Gekko kuhli]